MTRTRWSAVLAAVLTAAVMADAAAAEAPPAQMPPAQTPPTADASAAPEAGGIIDGYSRFMFGFNQRVYDGLDSVGAWFRGNGPPAPPDPTAGSLQNVIANVVNEPLTAVSSVAIGEFGNALRSAQRFSINSTVGVLGYYDTASQWGYTPTHTDIGLSLCRAGVGEYGYVVLPFVGPRTGRDAVADIVLMNVILWTTAGALAGTGASFQTIVIAESVEVVADITATRQFDIEAKAIKLRDYEAARAAYLKQRRARCAQLKSQ